MAEALAFGTLLQDGVAVRLTGQDVVRGAFSHRHYSLVDTATGQRHTALARLPGAFFGDPAPEILCLRSVLMKPEHEQWIDRIWEILDQAANS